MLFEQMPESGEEVSQRDHRGEILRSKRNSKDPERSVWHVSGQQGKLCRWQEIEEVPS